MAFRGMRRGRFGIAGSAGCGAVSGMIGGNRSRRASEARGDGKAAGEGEAGPGGRERGREPWTGAPATPDSMGMRALAAFNGGRRGSPAPPLGGHRVTGSPGRLHQTARRTVGLVLERNQVREERGEDLVIEGLLFAAEVLRQPRFRWRGRVRSRGHRPPFLAGLAVPSTTPGRRPRPDRSRRASRASQNRLGAGVCVRRTTTLLTRKQARRHRPAVSCAAGLPCVSSARMRWW